MAHVRVVASDDNLFDASQNLEAIDEVVKDYNGPRNLEALDLFSHEAAFRNVCGDAGLSAGSVDIRNDPVAENILCRTGFYNILNKVLGLVPVAVAGKCFAAQGFQFRDIIL